MVLDKIFAIKIKRQDGSYSDRIPIKALAQNIQWDSTHDISIKEILGNVDLTRTIQGQLNDLYDNKISANSLSTYVGHQLQTDVDSWLRQNINPNEVLKQTDLYGDGTIKTNNTSAEIKTSEANGRQYAVVKDNSDKLSVIVPWTDTDTLADMQYIWSGICTTPAGESNKSIILDKMDNFEINGDLTTINHGVTIAVYFTTGNTASSPKLTIQGSGVRALPIYYAVDNETTLEMDENTPGPWYTFTPGLKFFTCRKIDNKTVWLLTTVDYSLISHLSQTIATQDSPQFSGTPTAPTAATDTNNNQIATTGFVHNAIDGVLDEYLKTTTEMPVNSQNPPEQPSQDRQYPVVKDSEGNLSVNVPWSSSDADAAVQKIWTGTCSTAAASQLKTITLDNAFNFSIVNGTTIIVYFTNGNSASAPRLKIDNGGDDSINNILYQSDSNVVTVLTNASDIVGNWGAGLKIFTYYNKSSIGWLMQSPDMSHIRFLLNYKANIDSPAFTGYPTAETPIVGDNSKKLATTAFVNNAIANTSQKNSQNISKDFDVNSTYVAGDYVYYNGKLYKFVKTHAAGDWDRSEVDEISITGDIQSATQNLNSILVNNSSEVSLINKGQLSHFNDGMGFIKTSDTGDLIKYQYNYSNNTHKTVDPYIRTGSGSYGNGKSLIGLKFRLINSSEVPLSSVYNKFYITTEGDSPQLVYDINSISGIWTQASLCVSYPASSSELSHIKLYLHADPNYDYGNATVTVEIKDFYIYNLTNEIADNANSRNYIINEQNRNYQNGTAIYSLPNYGTDKTLTQEGKAADAAAVGNEFENILIPAQQYTLKNQCPLDAWQQQENEGVTIQKSDNYIKFQIQDSIPPASGFFDVGTNYQVEKLPFSFETSLKRKVLIGFNYKISSNISTTRIRVQQNNVYSPTTILDRPQNTSEWKKFSYTLSLTPTTASFLNLIINCRHTESANIDANIVFEIKDFFMYDLTSLNLSERLKTSIVNQQLNDTTYEKNNGIYYFDKRTDESLSIEGKAADAKAVGDTQQNIANVITSTIAEKNYIPGDLIILNNKLYKINSSISSGTDIEDRLDKTSISKEVINSVPLFKSQQLFTQSNFSITSAFKNVGQSFTVPAGLNIIFTEIVIQNIADAKGADLDIAYSTNSDDNTTIYGNIWSDNVIDNTANYFRFVWVSFGGTEYLKIRSQNKNMTASYMSVSTEYINFNSYYGVTGRPI